MIDRYGGKTFYKLVTMRTENESVVMRDMGE
jgi:hypothetical protein